MIASLPMYDRPETRAAHDTFWASFRDALGYGPAALDRTIAYDDSWAHPDLLLGQICNLPYRAKFRDQLVRISNCDHRLPDTPAGFYHSVFVVRAEDADRGLAPACLGRFAYNDALSQSGWGAPLDRVTRQGLTFHTTLRTGSHQKSMLAVANGDADLAAIDAVTWRMLQKWESSAQHLRVVGRTGLSPAMGFVTTKGHNPAKLRNAIQSALNALSKDEMDNLGLYGQVELPNKVFNIPLAPPPCRSTQGETPRSQ